MSSIIIRVKDEAQNLRKLFPLLKNQTDQSFEIVIVNDNSTDGSEKVVFDFFPKNRVKIVNIPKGKFTYPYACNLGAKNASGEFLVYISAHSYPISKSWLSDGLKNFDNPKVAGVFAYPLSGPRGTRAEKILDITNKLRFKWRTYKKPRLGLMGNTNAIYRKDLWEEHKFDEGLIESEDSEWAYHILKNSYYIVHDPRFAVFHSHHLSFVGLIGRKIDWIREERKTLKKSEKTFLGAIFRF